jgi:hypothetical protein
MGFIFLFHGNQLNSNIISDFIFFPKFIKISMNFGRFQIHLNQFKLNLREKGKGYCAAGLKSA